MMTTHVFDKETLLEEVKVAWTALNATLVQFDDAAMEAPCSADGWSVKDIIAHISFWEQHALERFVEVSKGKPSMTYGPDFTEDDLARLNAEVLAKGRAKSLEAAKADFEAVHRELMMHIASLPEALDDA